MISEELSAWLVARQGALDWVEQLTLTTLAARADSDTVFINAVKAAEPTLNKAVAGYSEMLFKVGPKGYIHGWIFVGAPGVGARVFHPKHGMGTVTGHDGKHATVKFDKTSATHSFEAREHTAKGRLTTREDHARRLADGVAKDPGGVGKLNDSELKDVDGEFGRRATALGKDGQVSKTHQKIKDEVARRGATSGGNAAGASGVEKDAATVEGAYRKVTTGDGHPALLSHVQDESGLPTDRFHAAVRHMASTQVGRTYLEPEPKLRSLTDRDRAAAIRLGGEDKHTIAIEGPAKGREGAAAERQRGDASAVDRDKAKEYAELSRRAHAYNASSPAKPGSNSRLYDDPDKQHEAIRLHRAARRMAPNDKEWKRHGDEIRRHLGYLKQIENNQKLAQFTKDKVDTEAKIKDLGAHNRGSDAKVYDQLAEAHDRLADIHEQRDKYLRHTGPNAAVDKHRSMAEAMRGEAGKVRADQVERHKRIAAQMLHAESVVAAREKHARKTGKQKDISEAIRSHQEVARYARSGGLDGVADKHDAAAKQLADDAAHGSLKPEKGAPKTPPTDADKLSAKASRTGKREDHVKASIAQHQAGNRSKASNHREAVESIDASDEYKDEAEQHADAAERTQDPDLHKAAAESYRNAAEHMDDVPGGKKAAADLRGKAEEHDNIAQRIIHATADYVKSFLHANRTGHKADKKDTADAHRAAADAENEAAARAITGPQRRHHAAEAARHIKAAEALDAKTSVSAA